MKAPETMKLTDFMKFIHVGYTKFYEMMKTGEIDARKTYKEGRYRTIEMDEAHRVKNNILSKSRF